MVPKFRSAATFESKDGIRCDQFIKASLCLSRDNVLTLWTGHSHEKCEVLKEISSCGAVCLYSAMEKFENKHPEEIGKLYMEKKVR